MKVTELRAIAALTNEKEVVKTGFYVTDKMTIDEIKKMFAKGIDVDGCPLPVTKVEFDLEDKE